MLARFNKLYLHLINDNFSPTGLSVAANQSQSKPEIFQPGPIL